MFEAVFGLEEVTVADDEFWEFARCVVVREDRGDEGGPEAGTERSEGGKGVGGW